MVRWYFNPLALPTFKFRLACLWSISQEGTVNLKWFTKWRKTGTNALCWEKCAHIHDCRGVAGKPVLHPLQHRVINWVPDGSFVEFLCCNRRYIVMVTLTTSNMWLRKFNFRNVFNLCIQLWSSCEYVFELGIILISSLLAECFNNSSYFNCSNYRSSCFACKLSERPSLCQEPCSISAQI